MFSVTAPAVTFLFRIFPPVRIRQILVAWQNYNEKVQRTNEKIRNVDSYRQRWRRLLFRYLQQTC